MNNTAQQIINQHALGNIQEAKRLAKWVSWRVLFLAAMDFFEEDSCRCIWLADRLKGIDS